MLSRFDPQLAKGFDDLEMRVYTSRLLGQDKSLVLHGGGNTSLKWSERIYVKGSGWDLATIEIEGFSPVRTDALLALLEYETLSDTDMVKYQREALTRQSAPNPSIEAILHALIPFKFVDHTHADAIVTISNTVHGEKIIEELYGSRYLIVPYVMPGFDLAKKVYEMTRGIDWNAIEGIILHNHGVFTFDDDARRSYEKMLEAVSLAVSYLNLNTQEVEDVIDHFRPGQINFNFTRLQTILSEAKGYPVTIRANTTPLAQYFASEVDDSCYRKGILTPEHIIRTKRFPAVFSYDYESELADYIAEYKAYFDRNVIGEIMLNPAPNWAVIRDYGIIAIGKDDKEASVIEDIVMHTIEAILRGEAMGGYQSLSEEDCFAMEYWELEQMKLKKK